MFILSGVHVASVLADEIMPLHCPGFNPGVILTLAVAEVQSLVPLGTLQLAIFYYWEG